MYTHPAVVSFSTRRIACIFVSEPTYTPNNTIIQRKQNGIQSNHLKKLPSPQKNLATVFPSLPFSNAFFFFPAPPLLLFFSSNWRSSVRDTLLYPFTLRLYVFLALSKFLLLLAARFLTLASWNLHF